MTVIAVLFLMLAGVTVPEAMFFLGGIPFFFHLGWDTVTVQIFIDGLLVNS